MLNYLPLFLNLTIRRYTLSFYSLLVFAAEQHFLFADAFLEKVASLLRPVYSPFAHYFVGNEPLKRYVWYIFCSFAVIFMLPCRPVFVYFFISLELFAILFSIILPSKSYIVRRCIFAATFATFLAEICCEYDALLLVNDVSEFFYIEYGLSFIDTHLIIQDLIDGIYFWFLYFFVFYLPYLALTLVLVAPLISFFYAFFFGFMIGYRAIGYIASLLMSISFLSSVYILLFYPIARQKFLLLIWTDGCNPDSYFNLANMRHYIDHEFIDFLWVSRSLGVHMNYGALFDTDFLTSRLEFSVDSVSGIFIFVITFISTLVHMYSIEYMKNDPHAVRFFGLLGFFSFSMIVLVTSGDLLVLFVGWEGVGLSSFLLIGFWYTRVPALKSALKAILMNKIGDLFLLCALAIMAYYAGGDTSIILSCDNIINYVSKDEILPFGLTLIDLTAVLLTLAAFVKSAQLFFHTWLPDAMEGPTPVSALLHAATMVTAGVYVVIRFSFLIEFSYAARMLMLIVGAWTLVITSIIALFQYDIKKIIAYSTCGQLAMMFIACGLSGYDYALFHFFNHAFFKCLLFLLAGIIIHELKNQQDIRVMGRLSNFMPYTFSAFSLAMLSSLGFPFFSGAVSKDLIIALVDDRIIHFSHFSADEEFSSLLYISYFAQLRFAIVVLTALYMLRLYYYVFFGFPNHRRGIFNRPGYVEPVARSPIYAFVVTVLVLFSLAGGKIFKNLFIFSDANYVNIHNDMLTFNTDTLRLACSFNYNYITHFIIVLILLIAYCLLRWVQKNGHFSFFLDLYDPAIILKKAGTPKPVTKKDTFKSILCRKPAIWYYEEYLKEKADPTYVSDYCPFREAEEEHLREAGGQIVMPPMWPMKLFRFFNKRCYFDDVYNYWIVQSVVLFSVYIRLNAERGVFLYASDLLSYYSKRIGASSGYISPSGFLINLFFIAGVFIFLWFFYI